MSTAIRRIPERKSFPLAVVLTLTCDRILIRDLDGFYDCVSWVLGYRIFTSDWADVWLRTKVLRIYAQHPGLRGAMPPETEAQGEAYLEVIQPWLEEMVEKHGASLSLERGTDKRTEHPGDTFLRVRHELRNRGES